MEARSSIKILPNYLIDQIKAGEVIEGPASLIKELVENSIDAKPSQIKIQIENNGLDLISVEDDGRGIDFNDLPLAFCRHATSKIEKFEDLYSLDTFGFRGEALASIASISRVTAFSKPVEGVAGKITYHGGNLLSHLKMESLEQGTSIIVKDLFFNTPVRFKFIKSKTSEKNNLFKVINSFIISNPSLYFSVKWDEKDKIIFQPTNSEERILQVLPNGDYRKIKGEYDGYTVEGFISIPSLKGSQKSHQFLFINNRCFFDRALHTAVLNSMAGIWGPGETGSYYISLTTDPAKVDINVHPRKTEVKFVDGPLVFSLIHSAIKNSISPIKTSAIKNDSGLGKFLEQNTQIEREIEEKNPNPFFKLSENFILIPIIGKYFILDLALLLKNFLEFNFKPIEENSQIPLLIGEPYRKINKNLKTELKSFGFNFEEIDENRMILLSIPPYLTDLPFRKIIGHLLLSLNGNGLKNFYFENLNLENLKLNFSQVKILVKPFEKNLLDKSFAKELDESFLKSLFI